LPLRYRDRAFFSLPRFASFRPPLPSPSFPASLDLFLFNFHRPTWGFITRLLCRMRCFFLPLPSPNSNFPPGTFSWRLSSFFFPPLPLLTWRPFCRSPADCLFTPSLRGMGESIFSFCRGVCLLCGSRLIFQFPRGFLFISRFPPSLLLFLWLGLVPCVYPGPAFVFVLRPFLTFLLPPQNPRMSFFAVAFFFEFHVLEYCEVVELPCSSELELLIRILLSFVSPFPASSLSLARLCFSPNVYLFCAFGGSNALLLLALSVFFFLLEGPRPGRGRPQISCAISSCLPVRRVFRHGMVGSPKLSIFFFLVIRSPVPCFRWWMFIWPQF